MVVVRQTFPSFRMTSCRSLVVYCLILLSASSRRLIAPTLGCSVVSVLFLDLVDFSLLGLFVDLHGKLLDVSFEKFDDAAVLAVTRGGGALLLDEGRLVEVAERAPEPPAEDGLVVVLVFVFDVLRWVHVGQNRIDVVVQLFELADLDVLAACLLRLSEADFVSLAILLWLRRHGLEKLAGCPHAVKLMPVAN